MLTISKIYIYFLKVGDNMLYDYLIENYEEDEPIFLTDINIEGMTEENIRYHLKKLTDNGTICRFDSGIYYLPRINIFGEKSVLSAETVALHKYILRKGKRIGFYSGYTLANRMGISMQVPFKEEITSNYAPAQVREISIKNRKYVLRRPVIEITEENAYVLQLLDCLKDIDKSAEEDMKVCGKILSQYSKEHQITKEQIDKFLEYYPIKIYKAIYETGVEYVFA
jgi:predicted transcriptional regulator of viral defense system